MKVVKLVVPFLLIVATSMSTAKADWDGLGLAYLYGYGGNNQVGTRAFAPAPPYFALHPPVYYGQRFSRPYGVSPFATWPQIQGNTSYRPAPHVDRAQMIANPYANCKSVAPSDLGAVRIETPKPLVISNPYYKPAVQYTSK